MCHVLIIDDRPEHLENIVLHLELQGYDVIKADDGDAAIHALQTSPVLPDIIVSDIDMPHLNGYKLLEIVQNNPQWADIPFIFLTGLNSIDEIRFGKKLGADDYLVKPVGLDDLTIAIENKLQRMQQWKRSTERQVEIARTQSLSMNHTFSPAATNALFIEPSMATILEELEVMPNEFSHKAWEALQKRAYQASQLLRQIGLLLQIDQGSLTRIIEESVTTCDLTTCLEIAISVIRADFDLPESKITLKPAPAPVLIPGAPEILIMIFSEIIHNAVIFSELSAPVRVTVRPQQDFALIEVADKGRGITESQMPLVWERFTQFCQTDYPQQGVGLGLAIVNECIGFCNGAVSISSAPQQGTVVSLGFPRSLS